MLDCYLRRFRLLFIYFAYLFSIIASLMRFGTPGDRIVGVASTVRADCILQYRSLEEMNVHV